jgi:hypothetical protein
MFAAKTEYPCAIIDGDDQGLEIGFQWCVNRMEDGDVLTLFVPLKSSLRNSQLLQTWSTYRDVDVVTSRGSSFVGSPGPVLAVWPDMDDLGKVTRSDNRVRALCVAAWVRGLDPPMGGGNSSGDSGGHARLGRRLHTRPEPGRRGSHEGLTLTVNHNNTIAAGREKDHVVN